MNTLIKLQDSDLKTCVGGARRRLMFPFYTKSGHLVTGPGGVRRRQVVGQRAAA